MLGIGVISEGVCLVCGLNLTNMNDTFAFGLWICFVIVINRFVTSLVTLAIPVLPFEKFLVYLPKVWEWGDALGFIGYGGLVLSLSYRYLPVFPHERDLNPNS